MELTKSRLQQWIIIKSTTHIAEQTVCTMPSDKYGIWLSFFPPFIMQELGAQARHVYDGSNN